MVLDVGGTHVKVWLKGRTVRAIPSGPCLTPAQLVRQVTRLTSGWSYDVISLGYPGPVYHGRPLHDPVNLGDGWVGFDFEKALGCPVRMLNDAALQALGSYRGGRMLFLGLGTGLGTAMIVDGKLEPMELGHLPYRAGRTYEEILGRAGLHRLGKKRWRQEVFRVVERLQAALEPEYIVLGGGKAHLLKFLPPKCRRGDNRNAYKGGLILWEEGPVSRGRKATRAGAGSHEGR